MCMAAPVSERILIQFSEGSPLTADTGFSVLKEVEDEEVDLSTRKAAMPTIVFEVVVLVGGVT